MKILNNVNFGLKEIVNCETATTPLNTVKNTDVKVTGFLIGAKDDVDSETGEVKSLKVGVIKLEDGQLVSTISPTVINSIETMINAYKEIDQLGEIEKGLEVSIKTGRSSKNRDFMFLELL
jgi:hypothetical protein